MHSSFISKILCSITLAHNTFYFTVRMFAFAYAKKNLKNMCLNLVHVYHIGILNVN